MEDPVHFQMKNEFSVNFILLIYLHIFLLYGLQ